MISRKVMNFKLKKKSFFIIKKLLVYLHRIITE